MTIAIIGAGLAGLACATHLAASGRAVVLFDKGRRPGGRVSTHRVSTSLGDVGFDHGAQYFTAREPAFRAAITGWIDAGLVAPWAAAGSHAFVGVPGMDAPVTAMAAHLDVRATTTIEAMRRENGRWRLVGVGVDATTYGQIVIAVPAEQVGGLLGSLAPDMAARAAATPSTPCWTIMVVFATRLPIEADVIKDRGAIGWAARDGAKPGRTGLEAWVIRADAHWSRAHLEEDRDQAVAMLLAAFAEAAGVTLPTPVHAAAHRWRYATSGSGTGPVWNADLGLGVCGDWTVGPKIESAWLSGQRLACLMLEHPLI
jgi:renalase